MVSTPLDLQGLRRHLDEIDDRLQDLLIERAAIVAMVAASKKDSNQPAFQPAREAEIIRRLVGRHHGAFPVATLIQMWREMLAATVRLQAPFSVAVYAPCARQGFWDLARDHYGGHTPITPFDAVGDVIAAVVGAQASVGVLPMPEAEEADPWWPQLLSIADTGPRIIARLPFGPRGNARTDGVDAVAIGLASQQESGADRTWLAAEWTGEIARARLRRLLAAAGLDCRLVASCRALDLVEIDGFVPIWDRRLDGLRAELGAALRRLVSLGGYAVPLPPLAFNSTG